MNELMIKPILSSAFCALCDQHQQLIDKFPIRISGAKRIEWLDLTFSLTPKGKIVLVSLPENKKYGRR
jgi:hypothetical protein